MTVKDLKARLQAELPELLKQDGGFEQNRKWDEQNIIIKNGELILCELKSSVSKADMYTFDRKVRFYEQRHHKLKFVQTGQRSCT